VAGRGTSFFSWTLSAALAAATGLADGSSAQAAELQRTTVRALHVVDASAGESPAPTLAQAQAAASRLAAGEPSADGARLSRARAAHWAPVLRAQAGARSDDKRRVGEQTSAPVRWEELGAGTAWLVSATWDLSQLIYDRDENQLVLAQVHLARRRQEVAAEVARLYAERLAAQRALARASGEERVASAIELLRLTGALNALTGGLFGAALERAQAGADRLVPNPPTQEEP
jgi:hypothetical protein